MKPNPPARGPREFTPVSKCSYFRCRSCGNRKGRLFFRRFVSDSAVGLNVKPVCDECQPPIPVDYERRNRAVKFLQYKSYAHYLASEMWQTIRKMVLDRDKGRCVVCGRGATDVHHNSYEINVLIGKDLTQLVSLCRHHHEAAEFDEKHAKRALPQVRQTLKEQGVQVPPVKPQSLAKIALTAGNGSRIERNEKMERASRRRKAIAETAVLRADPMEDMAWQLERGIDLEMTKWGTACDVWGKKGPPQHAKCVGPIGKRTDLVVVDIDGNHTTYPKWFWRPSTREDNQPAATTAVAPSPLTKAVVGDQAA